MDISVIRSSRGLVPPSGPTPSGTLDLSVIDRLPGLRTNARTLHVFRHGPIGAAQIIREALSRALVPYYPLAGRLITKEYSSQLGGGGGGGQLQIACSGEGVWFVEASADCTTLDSLNYFRDGISTPSRDLLLPDHPPESESIDPLVLIQVTQFGCNGFVMGMAFCHSICDGLGAAQFLNAVSELARGLEHPKIAPVWHRDFFPPPPLQQEEACRTVAFPSTPPLPNPPPNQLEHANVDISIIRITELKQKFKQMTGGQTCSTFEIVTAILWRQRTRAILNITNGTEAAGEKLMRLVFFANCRQLLQPPLPQGFYGNCFFPVTVTASGNTIIGEASNIAHVVKLIQESKAKMPQEFTNWIKKGGDSNANDGTMDPFAPPPNPIYNTLFVSEWGRLGFNQIDYGWGPPIHVVPVPLEGGPTFIPVAIVCSLPLPGKGIRLKTWCVVKAHLRPFLHHMNNLD